MNILQFIGSLSSEDSAKLNVKYSVSLLSTTLGEGNL